MLDFHITVMADADKIVAAIEDLKEAIMSKIDDALVEVANIESTGDSVIALLEGIAAELQEIKNEPAKIQEVVDRLRAQSAEFAAILQTYTPPAPAPEPEPPSP